MILEISGSQTSFICVYVILFFILSKYFYFPAVNMIALISNVCIVIAKGGLETVNKHSKLEIGHKQTSKDIASRN